MPITKFIIQYCSKQIIEDIKRLMSEEKDIFVPKGKDIQKLHEMDCQKVEIISVHPHLKTANLILLHISLAVESYSLCRFKTYDDWLLHESNITLDYYLTFTEDNYELTYIEARNGVRDNYDEQHSLRSDLIPYIQADHYDDEAEQFLRDIYPEALAAPMAIDVFEIAKRLGLHTQETAFKECEQILGRTYFDDLLASDTDIEEVIEKRTILYNANYNNEGQLHNTIVHECFHWYKHRHYFALKRLLATEDVETLYKEDAIYWIEKQANAITPRILMPKRTFSKMAHTIIVNLERTTDDSYINILERTVIELASFFQVSKQSTKLRMIEIGYPEVRGVLDYIDGHYIPPYSFQLDNLKGNQTFTIPIKEVDKLWKEDADFRRVMRMGLYVYLESHFILNLPDYVERDALGNLQLTKLAREHLDECALVFEYHYQKNKIVDIPYQEFILNRASFSAISFQMVYQNGYEHSTKEKQDAILVKQLEDEDRIYSQLSNNFEASMKIVKKWRGVTYREIAEALNYEERQIRRLFKGEGKIESFLLLCVYLNLPPSISGHLLEKSKWKLDMGKLEHRRYQMVLNNFHSQSIKQAKEFLHTVGVEV